MEVSRHKVLILSSKPDYFDDDEKKWLQHSLQ